MKVSDKDIDTMTDKEIEEERLAIQKHMDKIKQSPINEHPEDYMAKFKKLKKDKKVGKKERILYFMIVILKTVLCSRFADYRTRVENTMKKHKVDPEVAVAIMKELPTSYAYGSAIAISIYDEIKKLINKEIKASKDGR